MQKYPQQPFLYYYPPKKKRSRSFAHRILKPYKNLMLGFAGISLALSWVIIY